MACPDGVPTRSGGANLAPGILGCQEVVVVMGDLVCRYCGKEFPDRRGQLPGLEDSPEEFSPSYEPETTLTFLVRRRHPCWKSRSHRSTGGLLGSHVLEDGVLRWEGINGRGDPYGDMNIPIRASEVMEDGWIRPSDGPERWLRALPGYMSMRGHMASEIVQDT